MAKEKQRRFSIYDDKAYYESALAKLKARKDLGADGPLILDFLRTESARGISLRRQVKHLYMLLKLREWLALPFEKAGEPDFKRVVGEHIENNGKLAAWTRRDYKICLLKFYSWLRKAKGKERLPELEFISTKVKMHEKLAPEELITEADMRALANSGRTMRDKAFIGCLYESAARISEFMGLRLKHVVFDSYGALLSLSGKTGPRRVRVVEFAPYLKEWIKEYHPEKDNPEAALWPAGHPGSSAPPGYAAVCKLLRKLKARAGIKKPMNPHAFRHSRLTYLANKLTDAQLKQFAGWTQASSMAAVYVHMSGRDVDDAMLGIYGLKERAEDSGPKIKSCPFCGEKNMPEAVNCINKECGMILDIQKWKGEQELERDKREALFNLVKDLEAKVNEMQGKKAKN